jgi:hypothetical protein
MLALWKRQSPQQRLSTEIWQGGNRQPRLEEILWNRRKGQRDEGDVGARNLIPSFHTSACWKAMTGGSNCKFVKPEQGAKGKVCRTGDWPEDQDQGPLPHWRARATIWKKSDRMKARYDLPANSAGFQEGDQVWLYRPIRTRGKSPEFQPSWESPHKMITRINDVVSGSSDIPGRRW